MFTILKKSALRYHHVAGALSPAHQMASAGGHRTIPAGRGECSPRSPETENHQALSHGKITPGHASALHPRQFIRKEERSKQGRTAVTQPPSRRRQSAGDKGQRQDLTASSANVLPSRLAGAALDSLSVPHLESRRNDHDEAHATLSWDAGLALVSSASGNASLHLINPKLGSHSSLCGWVGGTGPLRCRPLYNCRRVAYRTWGRVCRPNW